MRRVGGKGRPVPTTYDRTPGFGDHACSLSNLAKLRAHDPGWEPSRGLDDIVEDVFVTARAARRAGAAG